MRKLLTIAFIFSILTASAQDAIRKTGFGINQDYNDYNVRLVDKQFTSFDSSLSNSFRVSFGKYLNRNWEFNAGISNGFVLNQTQGDQFIKKSYSFGVDADILFKLNNDKILPQTSRLAPYLSFGYNLNYLKAFKSAGLSPYTVGNEYGIGLKIKVGDRSYINLQTALIQDLTGDFDTHMQYRMGFNQSIGKRAKETPIPSAPDKLDYDKDGVADILDKCPTIAGIDSNYGCPSDWKEPGFAKEQEDSLMLAMEQMMVRINELEYSIDSLELEQQYAKIEPSSPKAEPDPKDPEPTIGGKTKDADEPQIGNKPKDVADGGPKDQGQKPKTETPNGNVGVNKPADKPAIDGDGNFYDHQIPGEGYYIIAISTKDKALAEKVAGLLDEDFPIVRILPQSTGFYRVGIYATRERSEADSMLTYAKKHGVPSGWLSYE